MLSTNRELFKFFNHYLVELGLSEEEQLNLHKEIYEKYEFPNEITFLNNETIALELMQEHLKEVLELQMEALKNYGWGSLDELFGDEPYKSALTHIRIVFYYYSISALETKGLVLHN